MHRIINATDNRNTLTQNYLKTIVSDGVTVLDLGSRTGDNLRYIDNIVNKSKLVAIDLYNKTEGNLLFRKEDLENKLTYADSSFDIVICNDVLEHINNKNSLLSEITRISKKHIICSLPNTQHISYIRGLKKGNMGKQYTFLQDDNLDRHKWITYYNDNISFFSQKMNIELQNNIFKKNKHIFISKLFGPENYVANQLFFCTKKN